VKYSGLVGFSHQTISAPGVVTEVITERPYRGDVRNFGRRLEPAGGAYPTLNDDVTTTNSISIVADAFANENILYMRYAIWQGLRWKIINVAVERPRLILTLGGQWNGETPS
jgi:hypothetical protein